MSTTNGFVVNWQEIIFLTFILVIILVMGGLGGLVNYFLTQSEQKAGKHQDSRSNEGEKQTRTADYYLTKSQSVLIGSTAALLIPLFLSLIQSSLISDARSDYAKLLIFAGFCVAAGISSRAFVRGMAERISREALQLAEDAKQQSSKAAQQAKDLPLDVKGELVSYIDKEIDAIITDQKRIEAPEERIESTPETHEQQLNILVEEYNTIRKKVKFGTVRTVNMTRIVNQMIELFKENKIEFDVSSNLSEDENPGKRLSAYAYLYAKPEIKYLDELITSAIKAEAFGQYWGILAISKILEGKHRQDLTQAVVDRLAYFLNSLERGTSRHWELSQILDKLR